MSRKRRSLTLDEKLKILKFVDENPTAKRKVLARQLDIPISTLVTLVGRRESIEANVQRFDPSCRTTRSGRHKKLDDFMFSWMSDSEARPSLEEMREMAEAVASSMGIDGFTASTGWLSRFRKRHGFARCKKRPPAQRRDPSSTERRTGEPDDLVAFLQVREQYHPRNVYVVGWSQLYYALLPSDLAQPDAGDELLGLDTFHATVPRREPRVGVILGVNEDCTDRLAPWVVGRRWNPRNLRGICNPPCNYFASAEDVSRCPIDALEQYLVSVDSRMRAEKRVVAVFLAQDLAEAAAAKCDFTNIRLYSLARGVLATNDQNPLHVGILRCFKDLYRTFLLKRLTILADQPEEARPTLLVAMSLVATSWDSLEQDVVRAAFKACGFRGCILSHLAAGEPVKDEAMADATDADSGPSDNYVQADEELVFDELVVKSEPCEATDVQADEKPLYVEVQVKIEPAEAADETSASDEPLVGDEGQTQRVVTERDALKALDTIRLFLCHNECDEQTLKAYRALESRFYNTLFK